MQIQPVPDERTSKRLSESMPVLLPDPVVFHEMAGGIDNRVAHLQGLNLRDRRRSGRELDRSAHSAGATGPWIIPKNFPGT